MPSHEPSSRPVRESTSASMSRFRIRNRTATLFNTGVDYLAARDWQSATSSVRSRLNPSAFQNTLDPGSSTSSRSFTSTSNLPRFRDMSARSGAENVILLPGWAQRRVARDRFPQGWSKVDAPEDLEDGEIELHISLHGFVTKVLDTPSRSQRVFNQMARQLAGLPRIQPSPNSPHVLDDEAPFSEEPQDVQSAAQNTTQERKHVSDKIAQKILENADDETIVRMMENLNAFPTDAAGKEAASREDRLSVDRGSKNKAQNREAPSRQSSLSGGSVQWENRSFDDIQGFHKNLSKRLEAYWVYRSPQKDVHIEISPVIDGKIATDRDGGRLVLASTRLTTDATGQFEHCLVIPWHMLSSFCRHYADLLQAAPDEIEAVEVRAKMLVPGNNMQNGTSLESEWRRLPVHEDGPRKVRVISDIDDTVKHTGVLHGAKQILRNVFVLPYHEAEVAGVASWYKAMLDQGVGLHYVTNAPLELHSLVLDFLEAVNLPVSHLVLKHYPSGARSLLSSWLEPAGERKRANVVKILDDFRSSQFILIGDSGELDLELYCSLAAERPLQIRGVFIRDVSRPALNQNSTSAQNSASQLPDDGELGLPKNPQSAVKPPPSAALASTQAKEPAFFDASYPPKPSSSSVLDLPATRYTGRKVSTLTTTTSSSSSSRPLSEQELKKAQIFQSRLTRATNMLPRSTIFRLFREGGDVEKEALQLIRELQNGTRPADRRA